MRALDTICLLCGSLALRVGDRTFCGNETCVSERRLARVREVDALAAPLLELFRPQEEVRDPDEVVGRQLALI